MEALWGIAGALALVAANAFFVAVEFSVTRTRPTQLDEWEREGRPGAGSARHAVENIDAYLSACQLGITLASIGLGVASEPALHGLFEPLFGDATIAASIGIAGVVSYFLVSMLHVVVGELSPKSLAIARTERTVLLLAPPMRLFYVVTKPLVDLFNWMGNALLKPFGIPPASEVGHAPHTEEELISLLGESAREGLIDEEEARFSERVLHLGDRRAREIMRSRGEVDVIDADAEPRAAADDALASGRTRLPAVPADADLDGAVGFVHARDLLAAALQGDDRPLRDVTRPLMRVPDVMLVDELLRVLRRERQHLALVVDEHGTAVGLVTLEDVIEEIVGEIEDEFDPRGRELLERREGAVVVDGRAPLRLVADELSLEIDDPAESTIGGHITRLCGRPPSEGEEVVLAGWRAQVLEADGALVRRLRLVPGEPSEPEGEEAS